MQNNSIITVENLSKRYQLGVARQNEGYTALRDVLAQKARNLFRPRMPTEADAAQAGEFWALKDVSFTVRRGEVVGIIGRNGAGKSTLLKVLSRITEPTCGRVRLRGRVASLLEVGTGFHPELTGRENVFLNGAILGMHRSEIKAKFDEIVAFAEVEKFLDTPVKRYSSGMYVRLAFAVAAHLDPEILIVDEVLAVGDANFQKKCLGKMRDVARGQGRTVLFVSHNMGAIGALCSHGVLLNHGRLEAAGDLSMVISRYLTHNQTSAAEITWKDPASAPGNERLRLAATRVLSEGQVSSDVDISSDITIEIEYRTLTPGIKAALSIHLVDRMGTVILATANFPSASREPDEWYGRAHDMGKYRSRCVIPGNFLNEGIYRIHVFLLTVVCNIEAQFENAVTFTVHESGAMRKEYTGGWIGLIRPKLDWRTEPLP